MRFDGVGVACLQIAVARLRFFGRMDVKISLLATCRRPGSGAAAKRGRFSRSAVSRGLPVRNDG